MNDDEELRISYDLMESFWEDAQCLIDRHRDEHPRKVLWLLMLTCRAFANEVIRPKPPFSKENCVEIALANEWKNVYDFVKTHPFFEEHLPPDETQH